ncbi:hypothetical protein SBA6_440008 [Candidatus Sulfopaludibacter sp. SbA6]|nr:hypothetical protein SBA6_440008 [Candidatus Sulfopaludibacter sp. SbA6]
MEAGGLTIYEMVPTHCYRARVPDGGQRSESDRPMDRTRFDRRRRPGVRAGHYAGGRRLADRLCSGAAS